jgi:hypothetical protein
MSKLYSAEQYDDTFCSKRLQNYEVPKCVWRATPKAAKNETEFIANERGHLMPGVNKGNSNPFGDYVGTWDQPKTIPGPYHLNKTSRTLKNVQKLHDQKVETSNFIENAREQQVNLLD